MTGEPAMVKPEGFAPEPVAWLYKFGKEHVLLEERLHREGVLRGKVGWTETPLYAAPPTDHAPALAEALEGLRKYKPHILDDDWSRMCKALAAYRESVK